MGDGITGHITKGPVHKKVDDYVNQKSGSTFVNRTGFLNKLMNNAGTPAQYLTILKNDVGLTQAEVNYLDTVWYGPPPQVNFQSVQPIYSVLQQGLIKALQEAITANLPLDSYWMPVGGPPMLAVVIAKSAAQVTRIIVTPPSHTPTMPRTQDAPMWAVTKQPSQPVAVGDTTDDAIVELVQGNIVTWHRREFPPAHATQGTPPATTTARQGSTR